MTLKPFELPYKTLSLVDNKKDNILDLHQDGAYRAIDCRLIMNMTNDASDPAVFLQDHILNYIKSVGIRINGRTFVRDSSLKMRHFVETKDKGTPQFIKAPITTANQTYDAIVDFTFDFAENVHNRSDISALLQTGNLSKLELVVATGDKNDIASDKLEAINSARFEVQTRYYQGTIEVDGKQADINDSNQVKLTSIKEQTQQVNLEPNMTQFDKIAQDIDLVAGAAILDNYLMIQDDGVRSDARVTDFKFQRAKPAKEDMIEWNWNHYHERNKAEYALENGIDGFVRIDWKEILGSRFGLVTGPKSSELLKLLTNGVVAGEDTIEVFTRFV